MMKKATYGQRAGAMLIDLLIILAVFAVFFLIFRANILKPVPAAFAQLMEQYADGTISMEVFVEQVSNLMMNDEAVMDYYSSYYLFIGLNIASFAGVYILYMIVLPLVWKKGQTVGRLAMKIRVQDEDSNDYSVGTAIIREGIGNLLITILLSCVCCCIPLIINLIILGKGNSIADSVSRSNVYSTIYKEEENIFDDPISFESKRESFVERDNTVETDFRIDNTNNKEDNNQ